ncbi:MAG: thermonuclease family protein [Candidatus Omnitrophica bacterium]|nr:thermonuclease family protein [Candidatus Omnitrophota bacterium]
MKTLEKSRYTTIRNSIRSEFERARVNVEDAARKELVAMYWRIGKVLNEHVMEADLTAAERAKTIRLLTRDFDQSSTKYFYSIAKFQRLYPVCPDDGLHWTHYKVLIAIDDGRERGRLEARIRREKIKPKQFQQLMSDLRRQKECRVELIGPGGERPVIAFTRGTLYYYRVRFNPQLMKEKRRAIIDLGFGIDREIDCKNKYKNASNIAHVRKDGAVFSFGTDVNRSADLYIYKAEVARVIDGDTLVLRIDLGFYTWIEMKVRLRGIDAPEQESILGRRAKEYVERALGVKGQGARVKGQASERKTPRRSATLPSKRGVASTRLYALKGETDSKQRVIVIRTFKADKYGRYLADVFYMPGADDAARVAREGAFLNQELLDQGLARVYTE